MSHSQKKKKIRATELVNFIVVIFLTGFNEEHTFFYWNEEAEKAGELPEVPEPVFPTEVAEELAKL